MSAVEFLFYFIASCSQTTVGPHTQTHTHTSACLTHGRLTHTHTRTECSAGCVVARGQGSGVRGQKSSVGFQQKKERASFASDVYLCLPH